VWDEEKQEWVNRWGRDGKNKEKESQWITEVPSNAGSSLHSFSDLALKIRLLCFADVNYDPVKAARDERKSRVAKNERQRLQNAARAQPNEREERKHEIEKTLASTRASTASMGKFDKKLDGEKKLRGVKRKVISNRPNTLLLTFTKNFFLKFEPTEAPLEQEKKASLALLSKMDSDARKTKKDHGATAETDEVLNVRKAMRFASKGRGGAALGREKAGAGRSGKKVRGGKSGSRK
jgi:regulator of ribosome biosynthesis